MRIDRFLQAVALALGCAVAGAAEDDAPAFARRDGALGPGGAVVTAVEYLGFTSPFAQITVGGIQPREHGVIDPNFPAGHEPYRVRLRVDRPADVRPWEPMSPEHDMGQSRQKPNAENATARLPDGTVVPATAWATARTSSRSGEIWLPFALPTGVRTLAAVSGTVLGLAAGKTETLTLPVDMSVEARVVGHYEATVPDDAPETRAGPVAFRGLAVERVLLEGQRNYIQLRGEMIPPATWAPMFAGEWGWTAVNSPAALLTATARVGDGPPRAIHVYANPVQHGPRAIQPGVKSAERQRFQLSGRALAPEGAGELVVTVAVNVEPTVVAMPFTVTDVALPTASLAPADAPAGPRGDRTATAEDGARATLATLTDLEIPSGFSPAGARTPAVRPTKGLAVTITPPAAWAEAEIAGYRVLYDAAAWTADTGETSPDAPGPDDAVRPHTPRFTPVARAASSPDSAAFTANWFFIPPSRPTDRLTRVTIPVEALTVEEWAEIVVPVAHDGEGAPVIVADGPWRLFEAKPFPMGMRWRFAVDTDALPHPDAASLVQAMPLDADGQPATDWPGEIDYWYHADDTLPDGTTIPRENENDASAREAAPWSPTEGPPCITVTRYDGEPVTALRIRYPAKGRVARWDFAWTDVAWPRQPGVFFFDDMPSAFPERRALPDGWRGEAVAPAEASAEYAPPTYKLVGLRSARGFEGRPAATWMTYFVLQPEVEGRSSAVGLFAQPADIRYAWTADHGGVGAASGPADQMRMHRAFASHGDASPLTNLSRLSASLPWPASHDGQAARALQRLTVTVDPAFHATHAEAYPLPDFPADDAPAADAVAERGPIRLRRVSKAGEKPVRYRLEVDPAIFPDADPRWMALAEVARTARSYHQALTVTVGPPATDGRPTGTFTMYDVGGMGRDQHPGRWMLHAPRRGRIGAFTFAFDDVPLPARAGFRDFAAEMRAVTVDAVQPPDRPDGYTDAAPLRLTLRPPFQVYADDDRRIERFSGTLILPPGALPDAWLTGDDPWFADGPGALTTLETDLGAVPLDDPNRRMNEIPMLVRHRPDSAVPPLVDPDLPVRWQTDISMGMPAGAQAVRDLRGHFTLLRPERVTRFTLDAADFPTANGRTFEADGVRLVIEHFNLDQYGQINVKGDIPLPEGVAAEWFNDQAMTSAALAAVVRIDSDVPELYNGQHHGWGHVRHGRIEFNRYRSFNVNMSGRPNRITFTVVRRAATQRLPFVVAPFTLPRDLRLPHNAPAGPRGATEARAGEGEGVPVRLEPLQFTRARTEDGRDRHTLLVKVRLPAPETQHYGYSISGPFLNQAVTVQARTDTGETLAMPPDVYGGIMRDQDGWTWTIPLVAPAEPADRLATLAIELHPDRLADRYSAENDPSKMPAVAVAFADVPLPRKPMPPPTPEVF